MADDYKEKCCAYLCIAFLVLMFLYYFWIPIIIIGAIIIIIYIIYRFLMSDISFSIGTTKPRQRETPRRVSRTTMLSLAETIEIILHQKPKYDENDIRVMIQEKRNELGPEVIDNESAAMIVARELGVELYPKRGRPRKTQTPRKVSRTYIDPNGYRRYSDSDILVHRHIAEIYVIRRKLREDEVVHHINGNKLDNRSSNLRVMTWREHNELHDR